MCMCACKVKNGFIQPLAVRDTSIIRFRQISASGNLNALPVFRPKGEKITRYVWEESQEQA